MTRRRRHAPALGVPLVLVAKDHERPGQAFARRLKIVGRRWEGLGELPGRENNNRGPDVDALRELDLTGKGPGGAGAWCAVYVSAMCGIAAVELGWPSLPFETSRGAGRLTKNVAGAGYWIVKPTLWSPIPRRWKGELNPLDVENAIAVLWHRGKNKKTRWQKHVEIPLCYHVESDTLETLAGNVVPNRAAARRLLIDHDIEVQPGQALIHRRVHTVGSWRWRFAGLASLTAPVG